MRNITSVFRKALYDGNRNYQCTAYITLLDNTELAITNARIAQGGVSLDDNVSDTSSFTALGSAIINALTLRINNIYEEYSAYDFTGASLVLYISLTGVQEQPIKICTMTVEKVSYDGMLITLECLDALSKFDKPYTSTLTYPATLQSIIDDACTECGVTLATTTFPNYDFEIATKPNNEALTYREVVSYVATLAGCFARCNSNGALELKWFDKSALVAIENTINGGVFDEDSPYSTGDSVNGGVFNPWNVGDEADGGLFTDNINAHYITALSSQNLGTDDVVITGVQITVENEVVAGEETRTDVITRTYGTDDYVIKIENNPFITLTNMDTIGTFLQNQLAGLTFRYGTISHLNDPSIEAGDVAMVWDRKGNAYPLLITNTQFKVGSYQTTTCSADTPAKNSSTRFSVLTKSFVKTKNVVEKESNSLERKLNNAINSKSGMYETREPVGTSGAYIYYMHDKPNLSESSAVIKITNEAVAVTPNYQQLPEPDWYGLTVDGTFISNLLQTVGISFDWARGGTLTLGGQNNQNGTLTVKDANGNIIGTWDKDGINATINGGTFHVEPNGRVVLTKINPTTSTDFIAFRTINNVNGEYKFSDLVPSGVMVRDLNRNSGGDVPISLLDTGDNPSLELKAPMYGASTTIPLGIFIRSYDVGTRDNIRHPTITLRGNTTGDNSYFGSNPKLTFQNANTSQSLALVFTDQDSVQAPASLTLAGNQGGEYFIAPNIKATIGLEIGAAKFYTPSEVTATNSGSYITSGTITVRRRGNVAHIYGNITIGSAVTSQTTIATIPDGYRPITTDFFSATNGSFFRVNSNGTIQAQNALTAGNYYFSTTYPLA